MDSYLLFELAYMLHRIDAFVIHGEHGLMETPGEPCLFYSPSEPCLHDISSYPPPRWTPSPPFPRLFLLTGIRLTRWSFRAISVTGIWHLASSSSLEETSKLEGVCFCCTQRSLFLDHQSLVANPSHQLAHVLNDLFVDNHFHLCGASANYLLASYPCHFHVQGHGAHPVDER